MVQSTTRETHLCSTKKDTYVDHHVLFRRVCFIYQGHLVFPPGHVSPGFAQIDRATPLREARLFLKELEGSDRVGPNRSSRYLGWYHFSYHSIRMKPSAERTRSFCFDEEGPTLLPCDRVVLGRFKHFRSLADLSCAVARWKQTQVRLWEVRAEVGTSNLLLVTKKQNMAPHRSVDPSNTFFLVPSYPSARFFGTLRKHPCAVRVECFLCGLH